MSTGYDAKNLTSVAWALSSGLALVSFSGFSQADLLRPRVEAAVHHDTSRPLLQMVQENVPIVMVRPDLGIGSPAIKPIANKPIPTRQGLPPPTPSPDPIIDAAITPLPPGPISLQFDFSGVSSQDNYNLLGYRVLPPDTNGDVGPNHYMQWVNLALQIWSLDRSSNTASPMGSPVPGNVIWSGFDGPCETTNDGDPIVLYDSIANRWMISQFAIPGPYYQCVAVSATSDPTGPWHRYEFKTSDTLLNDYGKFGVWPDGYYMAVNQFGYSGSWYWAGQGVAVFERDKMLNGQAATMVYFNLGASYPLLGGMLPSDLDGSIVPPKGAPNVFAQIDDDNWPGISQDSIQYWNFHVDWANPGLSTFTKGGILEVASFDSNMCLGARDCVRQPVTSVGLDAIADRLMYRLQYRNFGTHESLVVNHTVDVNGSDQAAVRWYELRRTGGNPWQIYQQSTYSPDYPADTASRWMGSAAMNGGGQIGLGYSISSSSIYPSIAFTGRQPDDALGTMTEGENLLKAGSGVQTNSSNRWGDYSSMSVDPVDDCTFWYTNEYYDTDTGTPAPGSTANWKTHIASFLLPDCSSQTFNDTPSTNWAYNYINAIFGYGISYGCGDGNFCPSDNVDREQMATFMVRAVAGDYPTSYCGGIAPFNDVDPNSWACGYIKKAKELGITNGCGDGNYCPKDSVPRDQMAVFLARAKSSSTPPACVSAPFNDVPTSYWACSSIQYIKQQAITLGCGDGNYCPSDFVPREQMAAFLARAFVGMP